MLRNKALFSNFIENVIKNPSTDIQKNYMDILSQVAETIKSICESENLIFKLNYRGRKFWENIGKNIESCFVDGGIYSSALPSSAPFAVRTKSYIINPSKSLTEREKFEETLSYMGDLYDVKNNLYDLTEDPYEDNQLITKKKDVARILFEISTIVKHVYDKRKFDYCFLHGPLQTPVMPFSGPEFPTFRKQVIKDVLPFFRINDLSEKERHFINIYFNALKYLNQSKFPIYGVVEKTNSTKYTRNLLYLSVKKGAISENDYDKILSIIKRYKLTDASLFEIILSDCEVLKPLQIDTQISAKVAGSEWEEKINSFPKSFVGFIKTTESRAPIRVESLSKPINLEKDFEYILSCSKLLPSYGYPVGLDIVDKSAKIPSWLGRAAKNHYSKFYLDLAIKKDDKKTIDSALSQIRGHRSWKNRPRAGRI